MQKIKWRYPLVLVLGVALFVFDLSLPAYAVAAGFAFFIASVLEDGFSGREGLFLLLGAVVLLLGSVALAFFYNESFTEFVNNNSHYLQRIPFFAFVAGVWGLCLVIRSLFTGRWREND